MRATRCIGTFVAMLLAANVWAQAFPNKPVRFLVGSAPGGILDVAARTIGNRLTERWGQPVLVEFRLGAAGSIAGDALAKSAPDGYTMLVAESGVWGISPHLVSQPPYDPRTDFAAVTQVGVLPVFLVIPATVPATNLREFIAYARQNQGKLSYASGGVGSIHQLSAELFKSMAKLDILHVPYKGGGPAAAAVMTGEVQMAFTSYAGALPGLSTGRLRMLGISTAQRAPTFPDIRTVAESGVPGFGINTTLGIIAPAATPKDLVAKVHADVLSALAIPEVSQRLSEAGLVVSPASGEQFGAVIRDEYAKFGDLVKLSGTRRGD
ncbi:MAG TPA: tripartite tricarboxylate transporter substrate binding protein [Burkholderiales bacterium]|nr:tripartite tricarboxylate transporter substrate binding protein [Burkholderiales bacterium]